MEMVFSVVEGGPDSAWPPLGPLGTGDRPAAVPFEHGRSLVVIGPPAGLPVSLLGRAQPHRPTGVSAIRR